MEEFIKDRMVKIIPESRYPGMYYLELEDGKRSRDFYNITRATELLRRVEKGEKIDSIRIGFEV